MISFKLRCSSVEVSNDVGGVTVDISLAQEDDIVKLIESQQDGSLLEDLLLNQKMLRQIGYDNVLGVIIEYKGEEWVLRQLDDDDVVSYVKNMRREDG